MMRAVASRLRNISEIEPIVMRDTRLGKPDFADNLVWVTPEQNWRDILRKLLSEVELFWPIAPEEEGVWEDIYALARQASCMFIGVPEKVLFSLADKRKTADSLCEAGIPHIPTFSLQCTKFPLAFNTIIKRCRGAGGEDIKFVQAGHQPPLFYRRLLASPSQARDWIVQPYLSGMVGSFSLIYEKNRNFPHVLGVNHLLVERNKASFHTHTWIINGLREDLGTNHDFLGEIKHIWPDLCGFIGIDFIIPEATHVQNINSMKSNLCILEINPRVTIPFCGLGESMGKNPALMVLQAVLGKPIDPRWEEREIRLARLAFSTK